MFSKVMRVFRFSIISSILLFSALSFVQAADPYVTTANSLSSYFALFPSSTATGTGSSSGYSLYPSYLAPNTTALYTMARGDDQALMAIHFLKTNDLTNARKLLDFLQYEYNDHATDNNRPYIFSFYNTADRDWVAWRYQSGCASCNVYDMNYVSMIWAAIAACHYETIAQDTRYHDFIINVATHTISIQDQKSDGRIQFAKVATSTATTSTAHNMIASAFLRMVYYLTNDSKFLTAAKKTESWVINSAYNTTDGRFNRGANTVGTIDTSFAVETQALSLLALNSKTVFSDAQRQAILQFAENNAKFGYGFDFSNRSPSPSAISYEWSLKMAAAYNWAGQTSKAETILQNIYGVLVSSSGIPEASKMADTTHGYVAYDYRSLPSLLWYVFAKSGFNPLSTIGKVFFTLDTGARVTNQTLSDGSIKQIFFSTQSANVTYDNGLTLSLAPGTSVQAVVSETSMQMTSTRTLNIFYSSLTIVAPPGTITLQTDSNNIYISLSTDATPTIQTTLSSFNSKTVTLIFNPSSGQVKVALSQGTVGNAVNITAQTLSQFPTVLSAPRSVLQSFNVSSSFIPLGAGVTFTLSQSTQPLKTVPITIEYGHLGRSDFNEDSLAIARFDESSQSWVVLPSSIDKTARTVTVSAAHFSTFQLIALAPAVDVQQAKVYPNPLRMHQGKTIMTFANLSAHADIRIYTYLGELVRHLSADVSGLAQWDAKNTDGQTVASGVYLAVIEGANATRKVLKLIVEK